MLPALVGYWPAMSRAMVLFPLPLSPTRARIWPRASVNVTSSTAWTLGRWPPNRPPSTGKNLLRLRTSRTTLPFIVTLNGCMGRLLVFFVEVAGGQLARSDGAQDRVDAQARAHHMRTARREGAARRGRDEVGRRPRNALQLPHGATDGR